ncbi:hypothetical protein ADK61_10305 [Streptomyces sp. XY66]|uniref:hypothetical protein n=1 Tax=Streptomyces sp. XY66 TaxID=1415563 RepID=UPI0006AE4D1E|nr:hypothetical protein [Streptomyces sp. XY66]KOU79676.1 hypothetical protein ADK61_10305 [Streptomyces sp. XY66]
MREVEYKSHGVPLEDYQLTRRDHRWQKELEGICDLARRQVDEHLAEARANPEMAERQRENLEEVCKLMLSFKTPEHMIMRWRVRLYCGHIVETSRHCENAEPSRKIRCPECGKDPSTIVAFEPLGFAGEPPTPRKAAQRAPTRRGRAELERRVAALEQEIELLRTERSGG